MEKNALNSLKIKGLTEAQAADLKEKGFYNKQPKSKTKSVKRIICENLLTLFNAVNFILAIMVIAVGSYKNALFINIVIINLIIGIVQEIRAKRTIDRLSLMTAPKASVLRESELKTLSFEEIVLGDVLYFTAGRQIPADAVVLDGVLEVNESLLTGESDPILKKAGDTLFSGSFVVSGVAYAEVEKVGTDSYASGIIAQVSSHRMPNSEMMRSLKSIIKVVSVVIIPVGLLLLFEQVAVQKLSISDGVTGTAAALIGMIPEGLILLTSIALAVSVVRLSRCQTLVQELYCIETLARVDTLCLDKTGTITEGCLEVKSMELLDNSKDPAQAIRAVLHVLDDDNTTFKALRDSFKGKAPGWQVSETVPFSSEHKYCGATFEHKGTYVIGAPDIIFSGGIQKKDQLKIENYAAQGSRILAVGHSEAAFKENYQLPDTVVPVALLLLSDKIRKDARETLEYFACQGVDIKIISGDHPKTVAEVARRAGVQHVQMVVDAATLTSDQAIAEAANKYTVFGRVTPAQKKQLIQALKNQGHTVAMTGDGVNDVLALREADCSIAMASGSDATRQIAQLVLLDSNFSNITKVLLEGRRVINNISRAASLFLVKTIFSFILAWIVIFANKAYPFVPIQLTLISALMIGIPAFFLALAPNHNRVTGSFMTRVLHRALPGGLTIVVGISAAMLIGHLMALTTLETSTMACILTGVAAMLVLYDVCQPMNFRRNLLFWSVTAAFILALLLFPDFFRIVPLLPLDRVLWSALLPLLLLVYPVMMLMRFIVDKLEIRMRRYKN